MEPQEQQGWTVGDGATLHYLRDSHAYTVTKVTAKTFTMQRDKATIDPTWKADFHPGGFVGHVSNTRSQRWTYEPDPDGPTRTVRLTKRGWMSNGQRVTPGRHEFYDHNL